MKNEELTLEEVCDYLESNGWVKHPKVNEYAHTRCYTDNQITLIFMSFGGIISLSAFNKGGLRDYIVHDLCISNLSELETILKCIPRSHSDT